MIDGSEKRNRQLAFELQNSHVCEKRSKTVLFFNGRNEKGVPFLSKGRGWTLGAIPPPLPPNES